METTEALIEMQGECYVAAVVESDLSASEAAAIERETEFAREFAYDLEECWRESRLASGNSFAVYEITGWLRDVTGDDLERLPELYP